MQLNIYLISKRHKETQGGQENFEKKGHMIITAPNLASFNAAIFGTDWFPFIICQKSWVGHFLGNRLGESFINDSQNYLLALYHFFESTWSIRHNDFLY